jgi:integrase
VYLSPPAVAHLTRWKATLGRGRHRHLFPAEAGERMHFTNARLAQSVADADAEWRPHDLRRTVTTRLQALGCPDEVCKRILGHAQESGAFGHYAHHTYETEQRDWLAKLAAGVLPPATASGGAEAAHGSEK